MFLDIKNNPKKLIITQDIFNYKFDYDYPFIVTIWTYSGALFNQPHLSAKEAKCWKDTKSIFNLRVWGDKRRMDAAR